MNLSFHASPKNPSDWIFLELLSDPSKSWRVDMYGQAKGEGEWLPLFSKVVGVSNDPGAAPERSSAEPLVPATFVPLVEPSVETREITVMREM
jgi:hypothetical protein